MLAAADCMTSVPVLADHAFGGLLETGKLTSTYEHRTRSFDPKEPVAIFWSTDRFTLEAAIH